MSAGASPQTPLRDPSLVSRGPLCGMRGMEGREERAKGKRGREGKE